MKTSHDKLRGYSDNRVTNLTTLIMFVLMILLIIGTLCSCKKVGTISISSPLVTSSQYTGTYVLTDSALMFERDTVSLIFNTSYSLQSLSHYDDGYMPVNITFNDSIIIPKFDCTKYPTFFIVGRGKIYNGGMTIDWETDRPGSPPLHKYYHSIYNKL